ncbi:hypothetical protein EJD97_017854 [Solanum chilense]|uniref:Uncharacterized protein n=1 Tax=Solanum chilense TaxID=4083 RepID=A0A6N2CDT2_SOLCI|nr:hypothetical protein EJD97_017854 [Solanum chilense]
MASSRGSSYNDLFEKVFSRYNNDDYDFEDDGLVVTISCKGNNERAKGQSSFSQTMMNPHLKASFRGLTVGQNKAAALTVDQNKAAAVASAEPRPAIHDVTQELSCISLVGGLIPLAEEATRPSKDQP